VSEREIEREMEREMEKERERERERERVCVSERERERDTRRRGLPSSPTVGTLSIALTVTGVPRA